MREYEEIKSELSAIAEILKQYPEHLQVNVFKILIEEYMGRTVALEEGGAGEPQNEVLSGTKQPGARKRSQQKESYRIVGGLDLAGNAERLSLRKFCEEKFPESGQDFNAVAVYYLQRILKVEGITVEHIYTCYKDTSTKMPGAFRQSLLDTSNRTGNIDTKNMNDIVITITGENFVEHDLPRRKGEQEVS